MSADLADVAPAQRLARRVTTGARSPDVGPRRGSRRTALPSGAPAEAPTRQQQRAPGAPPRGETALPLLVAGLAALRLTLSTPQVRLLAAYRDLLLAWNRRVNLTAVTDPLAVETRHFLDALSGLAVLSPAARTLVDVGSGGGLPGVPLAIARPDLSVLLVDAARKKVPFLDLVIAELALYSVAALWARAEEAGQLPAHRERYDVATARALAPTAVLAEYTLPLVRVGGIVVLWKHGDVSGELGRAARAITVLGGGQPSVHPVRAPGLEEGRCLVVVPKERPTPPEYPRPPGRPGKRPL